MKRLGLSATCAGALLVGLFLPVDAAFAKCVHSDVDGRGIVCSDEDDSTRPSAAEQRATAERAWRAQQAEQETARRENNRRVTEKYNTYSDAITGAIGSFMANEEAAAERRAERRAYEADQRARAEQKARMEEQRRAAEFADKARAMGFVEQSGNNSGSGGERSGGEGDNDSGDNQNPWAPENQVKDPAQNYVGKECSYFTQPLVRADGGGLNRYGDGHFAIYGEWAYTCSGGRWVSAGVARGYQNYQRYDAAITENSSRLAPPVRKAGGR